MKKLLPFILVLGFIIPIQPANAVDLKVAAKATVTSFQASLNAALELEVRRQEQYKSSKQKTAS